MDLRNPSHLALFLKECRLVPKRTLSQNFLIDKNVLQKIVDFAGIQENDEILEIGPGLGALSLTLLQRHIKVLAIEKDSYLASLLPQILKEASPLSCNARILNEDFLSFPLDKSYTIMGNIPYHITTPILEKIAFAPVKQKSITLLIQKEMKDRLWPKNTNTLSILIDFFFEKRFGFFVSKNVFYPKPKVDSMVIALIPKEPPLKDARPFFEFIHKLFTHKRKTLKRILHINLSAVDLKKRPEALSLQELLILFSEIT